MVQQLKPQYTLTWVRQIHEIPQVAWDEMALPLKTPFLEWTWLHNMEHYGSAVANAGWLPNHLTVWRDQNLVAAAPLYLKSHSYGEFVFDHQWADLAQRLGVDYYPKLLGMSPFTPAEGYRFLIAPGEDERLLTEMMVAAIDQFCDRNNISGCHFLYVDPEWRSLMEEVGLRNGYTIAISGKMTAITPLTTTWRGLTRTSGAISNASANRWIRQGCG